MNVQGVAAQAVTARAVIRPADVATPAVPPLVSAIMVVHRRHHIVRHHHHIERHRHRHHRIFGTEMMTAGMQMIGNA